MELVIPAPMLLGLLIGMGWYAAGLLFNTLLLDRLARWYGQRRTDLTDAQVSDRAFRLAVFACGPTAWTVCAYETLNQKRINRRASRRAEYDV